MTNLAAVTRTGTAGKFRAFKTAVAHKTTSEFVGQPHWMSPGTDYAIPVEAPIGNQGDIGACTVFATKGAVWIIALLSGLAFPELSEKHFYLLERDVLGTPDEDSGGDSQTCLYVLKTTGVCAESVFPWTDSILVDGKADRPSIEALRDAANNRVPDFDWAAVNSLTALEQAIRANHPCIFGTEVDSTIQSYVAGQVLGAPNFADIIGGHEMVVVGVRFVNGVRQWHIRNSWGEEWGEEGYLWVDDGFMGNPTVAGSIYALLALPQAA